jgi:TolB-like protein/Tfp pilus assembly protein PilF
MASLISGFEYDIFISYRQKDNKHDGWVTEFVENLKGELESAFKEEVSVYFDINPHDGLLETHDVDASLKDKLKCLVFIPIISRTYCDPKSFAWEHEFKAFVEQASRDQFGLKIKLPNGNVANRVLPVRIYDLDNSDIKLCESILGTVLRGVEFIYKSAGVNRPLRANEDHPHDNLNKTYYRDQINKVANAIKEIITSIGQHEKKTEEVKKEFFLPLSEARKSKKTTILTGSIIALALIITGFFLIPKLFKSEEQFEKSIAVLPFRNFSEDLSQELKSDALTNEIINHLYKIKSFDRVAPFLSILVYKKSDKKNALIADELNVNYLLVGTYQRIGDSLKITASLIDPKSDKYLWQKDYYEPYKEVISIQWDIALKIASHVNAFLTPSEKQNIQKIPTTNEEAYQLVQEGIYLFQTRSFKTIDQLLRLCHKAIELDPSYADAYAWLGMINILRGCFMGDSEMRSVALYIESNIDKALELDQNNYLAHLCQAIFNEYFKWDYIKAEEEFLKAIELSPNNPTVVESYAEFLTKRNRFEDALLNLKNAETTITYQTRIQVLSGALSGNKSEAIKFINIFLNSPRGDSLQRYAGQFYLYLEEYGTAKLTLETALQNNERYILLPIYQACLALAYYKTNNYQKAQMIMNQLIDKSKETSARSPEYYIGWYYSGIGKIDSAFYWLEEAFKKRSPEMPWLKVDPIFKNLKDDNRYWDLYKRTGHKAYDDYRASLK